MEISQLFVRITLSFVILFTLARIMGRKEISQMTYFNWVSAIAIGSLTADLVINQDIKMRNGILALVGWALFTVLMGYIDIYSNRARFFTTGEPVVVIKEGVIQKKSLKKTRLDLQSLQLMLRQKDVFQLSEVDYAIFETNGKLSVMKKASEDTLTKKDMNVQYSKKLPPVANGVIFDGMVHEQHLARLQLDRTWLEEKLEESGIESVAQVFYGEVENDGTLNIIKQ